MQGKRLSTLEFVTRFKNIYHRAQKKNLDFSKTLYKNRDSFVTITCKIHGPFTQKARHCLDGYGCSSCENRKIGGSVGWSRKKFISEARKIHGEKYSYKEVNYRDWNKKIKIICRKHGEFSICAGPHLAGSGCQKCLREKRRRMYIQKAKDYWGSTYIYSKMNFTTTQEKVEIVCRIHGPFHQCISDHIRGRGCASCRMSSGEYFITKFLRKNKIKFIHEKSFDGCRGKTNHHLYFDFYLPAINILIEYDGQQHFFPFRVASSQTKEQIESEFLDLQERDKIKTIFAETNNIKLIRIPYTEFKNIESVLKEKVLNEKFTTSI